jgi:DNA-binding MarR family transcriptional regulator
MLSPPARDTAGQELEVWAALEHVQATIARALDRALERKHGLSLHGFELLEAAGSAPAQRLRMSELAARLPLTASGVTRLVARLERDGLVARVDCPEDGRVTYAQLSGPGRAMLHAAAETHNAILRDLLHQHFPEDSIRELGRSLHGTRQFVAEPSAQ